MSCEVIHGTGTANDGKTVEGDVCVAKGVGFNPGAWAQLGGGQAPGHANMDAIRDAIGPGNGVLKMTSTKDGKQEFDLEVTKIDRSSPSDATFTPPADYTAISMGRDARRGHEALVRRWHTPSIVLPEGSARMRHVWSLASVFVLGVSAAGAARAGAQGMGFEGTLTFQMQGEQGAIMTMVSTTKGNKLRWRSVTPRIPPTRVRS